MKVRTIPPIPFLLREESLASPTLQGLGAGVRFLIIDLITSLDQATNNL